MITSFEKKNSDLIVEFDKLNKLNNKQASFVHLENKWEDIDSSNEGNGYINISNDENIKYIKCVEGKGENKDVKIYTEKSFNKPKEFITYSLFYFEIKVKIEGENNLMVIGLKNCNGVHTRYNAVEAKIKTAWDEFRPSTFSWNDGDVFGCGLVYPPINKINEFPYVFFTQNGKQIGKAVKLNFDSYKPYAILKCCSVEANFGHNLEAKPFSYDISNHFLTDEFY
uniref:SPRY domain-containing protein n=1 Tax=Meloidogyne hapla TaxID=6305 RepID=A0A1I8BGM4_MELHA